MKLLVGLDRERERHTALTNIMLLLHTLVSLSTLCCNTTCMYKCTAISLTCTWQPLYMYCTMCIIHILCTCTYISIYDVCVCVCVCVCTAGVYIETCTVRCSPPYHYHSCETNLLLYHEKSPCMTDRHCEPQTASL